MPWFIFAYFTLLGKKVCLRDVFVCCMSQNFNFKQLTKFGTNVKPTDALPKQTSYSLSYHNW